MERFTGRFGICQIYAAKQWEKYTFPGTKQELLTAMLAAFTELIYLYDAGERKLLFISDNLTEVLGYPRSRVFVGNDDITGLVHPDEVQEVAMLSHQLLAGEKNMVRCNVRMQRAGGMYCWFSLRQVIFPTISGTYIFGILVDINERKGYELRIREQNAAIREYVFAASHTVRAPLSNILAITELFNNLPDDNLQEYRLWATRLKEQAHILDGIVKAMIATITNTPRTGV